jgi:hypothetical protein
MAALGHLIWSDWDTLSVKDRDDPLAEMIAKTIIKIAKLVSIDAAQFSALAIKSSGGARMKKGRPRA